MFFVVSYRALGIYFLYLSDFASNASVNKAISRNNGYIVTFGKFLKILRTYAIDTLLFINVVFA